MTALFDRFTVTTIRRSVTEVVAAYLTAFIDFGGQINGPEEWVAVAQIILAIKLHVFAIPLAFTPVLGGVPLWAWYVVVVMWLSKMVHYSGYTVGEMVGQLEDAYCSARESDRDIWHWTPELSAIGSVIAVALILQFGSNTTVKVVVVALSAVSVGTATLSRYDIGYSESGGDR